MTGDPLVSTEFTNSAAWLVREGWAQVEQDGQCHTAHPGQWPIVKPGAHVQTFSQDARMLSIAFEARWPDGSHFYEEGLSLVIEADEVPALEKSPSHTQRSDQDRIGHLGSPCASSGTGLFSFAWSDCFASGSRS